MRMNMDKFELFRHLQQIKNYTNYDHKGIGLCNIILNLINILNEVNGI